MFPLYFIAFIYFPSFLLLLFFVVSVELLRRAGCYIYRTLNSDVTSTTLSVTSRPPNSTLHRPSHPPNSTSRRSSYPQYYPSRLIVTPTELSVTPDSHIHHILRRAGSHIHRTLRRAGSDIHRTLRHAGPDINRTLRCARRHILRTLCCGGHDMNRTIRQPGGVRSINSGVGRLPPVINSRVGRLENFREREGDDINSCAVCLENFREGDLCRSLPECNHVFHSNCIDSWLVRMPTCPICRARVRLNLGASGSVIGVF